MWRHLRSDRRRHRGLPEIARTEDLLRFITCGSVDDGKSTLIGRLLYESKLVFEDQLAALEADSKKVGTQGDELDFALLVDGLAAEREQGITIDVAYRYFSTDRRKFIVADTPGHEQYTRNMVTGASTADLAVILIDARKGVLTQTRRHSYLVSLLGIRNVVLAVNKMDLVDYSQAVFDQIEADYRAFAERDRPARRHLHPGLGAARATTSSTAASACPGTRPDADGLPRDGRGRRRACSSAPFRHAGAMGQPARSRFPRLRRHDRRHDSTRATASSRCPRGDEHEVARIVTYDGDLDQAVPGQSVTLTLADEIDVSRGDVIASAADPPAVADQFEATIVWMGDEPMLPGRPT